MSTYKQLSLREKAMLFTDLIREPGWDLLQKTFRPEIRTKVTDTDAKEAFLYEAIRAQVIQEIFCAPLLTIRQAEREWSKVQTHSETDATD